MVEEKLNTFFETQRLRYGRCLDPTLSCEHKAIRAHSVQKATAIDLIAENNHVSEIKFKLVKKKPECRFELIGRNNASTFTGFCSEHDAEIFRPIDTKPLSIDDEEQLFLLAYRSVSRELHATLEGAMKIQSAYLSLVEKGEVPKDQPSAAGIEAVQHMMKAWAAWKYRFKFFDKRFEDKRFKELRHIKFVIKERKPSLAASSFFSADLKPWGKPFVAIIVNIVPLSESETAVIFSYARKHSRKAVEYLRPITTASGQKKLYELSFLLIDRAENFFVRPSVVAGWGAEKLRNIENAFTATVVEGHPERIPDLMLF